MTQLEADEQGVSTTWLDVAGDDGREEGGGYHRVNSLGRFSAITEHLMTELDVDDHGLSTICLDVAGGGEQGVRLLAVDCDCRFCFGDDIIDELDSSILIPIFGFGKALR